MSKYDDAFKQAGAEADAELMGKLSAMEFDSARVLASVEPMDRAKVEGLIAVVKSSTNAEQTKAAWLSFAGSVGEAALRAVRAAIL